MSIRRGETLWDMIDAEAPPRATASPTTSGTAALRFVVVTKPCYSGPVMWVVVALGGLGVVAAVLALLATRLEHMAVALCVVGGALTAALAMALPNEGFAGALLLLPLAFALTLVMLGALTVLEVDARPRRQLRWWKTLLLVPLLFVATALWPDIVVVDAAAPIADPTGVPEALTLLSLAGAALVVPLLSRRREAR